MKLISFLVIRNKILFQMKCTLVRTNILHENRLLKSLIHILLNVGQRISNSIPSIPESFKRYIRSDCSASLFMKPVSVDELLKICTSLNPSKAYGIDNISPRVVKESIFYFVEPLCNIFNKSIFHWCISRITQRS